jgi:hypothetical protein
MPSGAKRPGELLVNVGMRCRLAFGKKSGRMRIRSFFVLFQTAYPTVVAPRKKVRSTERTHNDKPGRFISAMARSRSWPGQSRRSINFSRCVGHIDRRNWALLPRGVEQSPNSSGNQAISRTDDAKSDAVTGNVTLDSGLRQVIVAWRTLPQPLRRAILAIVEPRT